MRKALGCIIVMLQMSGERAPATPSQGNNPRMGAVTPRRAGWVLNFARLSHSRIDLHRTRGPSRGALVASANDQWSRDMLSNHLLIFSPSAFQRCGHQQSYVTGLGEALTRQGVEVHVLGFAGSVRYPSS